MEKKVSLSVIVITKNEQANIKDCLESVKWADEIIIVDDLSEDNTVEIAKSYTDRIFQKKMDIEGRHRNWAYAQAGHSWVLTLDADERVTPQLQQEIVSVVTQPGEFKAFSIPRKNYIGSYWVRYGGWYPSPQLKLFQREAFRWEEVEVHPRGFLDGKRRNLNNDIIHYSYKNFANFLAKTNWQTTLEAVKWHKLSLNNPKKAAYKMNLIHALWRTLDRFIRSFFVKQGYRDGFVGLMVAYFASLYQIISYAKYRELKNEQHCLSK